MPQAMQPLITPSEGLLQGQYAECIEGLRANCAYLPVQSAAVANVAFS